ncbi:subtilase family protein [Chromatocurvus halotolerans]|uniref:Subtilase family protein n=2 Tax=Chromatocurvus halotolerans TaxID=1132028 RepID=A0A4R2L7E1_9GAMM|nr:subtilase family protein [Chromatocurvus halotolerans]
MPETRQYKQGRLFHIGGALQLIITVTPMPSASAIVQRYARFIASPLRRVLAYLTVASALIAAPALAQLPVGGYLGPDPVEEEVEDSIEEEVESRVEQDVEQITEQNIQEEIEQNIEETVEETIDTKVEGSVEEIVAETVETQVEDDVEQRVAGSVEDVVESNVEEQVAERVESGVEDSVEADVESTVAEAVEDSVEAGVEDAVAEAVEDSVASGVEEQVADSVESTVEEGVEGAVEDAVEDSVESRVAATVEERLENHIEGIVEDLESDLEMDESRILREQWLVMAEPSVFEELGKQGYLFDTVTELPGLGLRLAEVAAPSSFDITQVRRGVLDVVGKDRADVDLNHIYTAGAPVASEGEGLPPRSVMAVPGDLDSLRFKVGMIDSRVDTSHPALSNSRIQARSFARDGIDTPVFHGTAIASIIAGNADDYRGLAPNAELFSASVFELDGERGEIASTVSLIRALDWLMSSGVDVVNISLAGPPNRLLETALRRAVGRDVIIMAAAGNGGPVAKPMYPAAYPSVVAITAVDDRNQVFRLANRGDYLALAAPGVDLRHALSGGGYGASSGTSFAVPFAVTAAARQKHLSPGEDIITRLLRDALDLGPPGRDDIYGYGLLTLGADASS